MSLYRVNKPLKKWAEEKGYSIQGGVVTVMGETPVSVCNLDGTNYYYIRTYVDPVTADKEVIKSLKDLVKPYGFVDDNLKEKYINFRIRGTSKKKIFKNIEELLQALPNILKETGIRLSSVCFHCGQDECDTYTFVDGLVSPAHTECNSKRINEILEEVEYNETNGNYIIAIVAALIGAIIGAIPSFITINYMDYLIGYLFALIPLASAYGYRRAKGIQNAVMPIVVSIISLLTSIGLSFFCIYMIVNKELADYFPDGVPFDVFTDILKDREVSESFISFFVQVILFCLLGIYLAWRYMARTNKAKKEEINNMRRN